MQYILTKIMVVAVAVLVALSCFVALYAVSVHAYELTVNTAQAATSTGATTSEAEIVGDVTEQEFAVLLKSATAITERLLARRAVSGSIVAIGPDAKGQSTVLIEAANGSTSAFSLATKALIVRDDGTAAAIADLTLGQHVVFAAQDALLSPATVMNSEDDMLVLTKADGTDVTLGTSSTALMERGGEPAVAIDFVTGDQVVLVESEDTTGSSTVLAVLKPSEPEAPAQPEATTTATTTPEPAQNNTFLWIIIGVAILVLVIGYFLMRRGSSL